MMKGFKWIRCITFRTIDDILCRDEVNLEDILKAEDLIQEVNGLNENVLDYLKKPEIAQALIG